MPLTREFKTTVAERLRRDRAFRRELLREAIECLMTGDLETGKTLLRDYINATLGFIALSDATGIPVKSLMRMLGPSGNPQARNLLQVIAHLQSIEGISLRLKATVMAEPATLERKRSKVAKPASVAEQRATHASD